MIRPSARPSPHFGVFNWQWPIEMFSINHEIILEKDYIQGHTNRYASFAPGPHCALPRL